MRLAPELSQVRKGPLDSDFEVISEVKMKYGLQLDREHGGGLIRRLRKTC